MNESICHSSKSHKGIQWNESHPEGDRAASPMSDRDIYPISATDYKAPHRSLPYACEDDERVAVETQTAVDFLEPMPEPDNLSVVIFFKVVHKFR